MSKKILVIALPLFLILAALVSAHSADARVAWSGSTTATADNAVTIQSPVATTYEGDPDVPSQQNKRLGIAAPSDVTLPASIRNAWFGHGRVLLRVYLSRWFSQ